MRSDRDNHVEFGLYIHIPFCACRCAYCDFYSTTRASLRDAYVEALGREMRCRADELGHARVRTIYIGGGTPSQLSSGQLLRLFQLIEAHFSIADDAEITIEANPDDVTLEWVETLRRTRVNRVSMGVQTFDDLLLRLIRRRHDAEEACVAVRRLRDAGILNISIDLIYGLPGQTMEMFESDIRCALSLGVQHLSTYSLMYEEGTPLYAMLERGEVEEADEELSLAMYHRLIDRLAESGFEHYEISNFALPGFRSRHNSSYWIGTPYIGLGAGAHSYDGKSCRSWNKADLNLYLDTFVDVPISYASCAVRENEQLTLNDRFEERVFLGLRTREGICLSSLAREFGQKHVDEMLRGAKKWIEQGHLERIDDSLVLTRSGLFISDSIMADLI